VKDASGKIVYSASGETEAGNNDFSWDGKDANGNQLPDGKYTLSVSATASDGSAVSSTIASKAIVTAVDMSGTTPMLVLGAMEIPLSDVSLVGSNTADTSSGSGPTTSSDKGFSNFGIEL
jgi:flagellar basal-body rod modification protein FlgD